VREIVVDNAVIRLSISLSILDIFAIEVYKAVRNRAEF